MVGCPTDPPPAGPVDAGRDTPAMADVPVPPTDTPTDVPVPPIDVPLPDAGPPAMARTTPTNGSAIAVTAAADVLVAANRTAGTISVFDLDTTTSPPTVTRTADIAVADAEPWQVVIGNDDDTAYVTLREPGQIVRINTLHATPTLAGTRATVGAEATGIAISPLGTAVYAANWGEGTVTEINAATMAVTRTIDLNGALVATGALGTVTARPALAHPRAIVVTNDGDSDESDETIYVTEFFGVNRTDTTAIPTDDSRFDVARQGIVYRFSFEGTVEGTTSLAPIADTGFLDAATTPNTTGCFPNQLGTATINNGRLYVSGICASPRGPTGPVLDATTGALSNGANFTTEVHSTIWAVDLATNLESTTGPVLLTREFRTVYDGITPAIPAGDPSRRMPIIPTDFAFVPASNIGYLTAQGSDAVFRVRYAADGTLAEVGFGTTGAANNFINLAPTTGTPPPVGRLPMGIAIAPNTSGTAYVINETTRNVSIVGFTGQAVLGVVEATPMPTAGSPEESINNGRRFFVTGLGRWSFRGQAWNSCESCHIDGLTDNVTWTFGRGPRQSTSLDGSYGPTGTRRLFNWTAIFDEVHDFELNTRGNSGGVGAMVHTVGSPVSPADRITFDAPAVVPAGTMATATNQAGLNGAVSSMMPGGPTTPNTVLTDWDQVAAYIRSIRAPNAPTNLAAADVTAGRALFEGNGCAGCHGTDMWTLSRVFWTPNEANNAAAGLLRTTNYSRPAGYPAALNPPSVGALGTMVPLRFPAGATAGANDQIQCILSDVGTFPLGPLPLASRNPILVAGAPSLVAELRVGATGAITDAQGLSGFNPPALVGMSTGAPYFHAGNARTLEELFDATFDAHYQALSPNFLDTGVRADQVRQMVAFLLSIDDSTTPAPAPALGFGFTLCPATL